MGRVILISKSNRTYIFKTTCDMIKHISFIIKTIILGIHKNIERRVE